VPRFEPFAGVRYDPARVDVDDVVAPPYDVIGPDAQIALEARSPFNVVHIDLAREENGRDRYATAGCRFDEWLNQGILRTDPEPGFYAYGMGYHDLEGRARQIVGVLGALEVSAPGKGDVLPHEETQHKVRDDRLSLLRACRADLSPVWGLSMAEALTGLITPSGPPVARCTDEEGIHHRLWRLTQPAVVEAVVATVASAPVVIADGHHRYETALAYRDEQQAAGRGVGGDDDLLLALVCELADGQAGVRPIHRVLSELPDGYDVLGALEKFFEPVTAPEPLAALPQRMVEHAALGLLVPGGEAMLLRPRGPHATDDGDARPDAALLDEALASLPAHSLAYDPSLESVAGQVGSGRAQAGVLLRPVAVGQIARAARAGRRMPTKTTFFHPKPRTGMVFRRRADSHA